MSGQEICRFLLMTHTNPSGQLNSTFSAVCDRIIDVSNMEESALKF